MKTVGIFITVGLILIGSVYAQQDPKDGGIADTLRFAGGPLVVGESVPVDVVIFTDTILEAMSFGIKFQSVDSGFARFDSLVFMNHLADPSVLDMRYVTSKFNDNASPDSIICGFVRNQENRLPPVYEVLARVYFTGLQPGKMSLDTVFSLTGGKAMFVPIGNQGYRPRSVGIEVDVLEASLNPHVNLPSANLPFTTLDGITIEVSATSPAERPVTITDYRVFNCDNDLMLPSGSISLTGSNPATLFWSAGNTDIGIWYVVFTACDDEERCSDDSLLVQIVEGDQFISTFDLHMTTRATADLTVTRGDLDNDGYDEFTTTGTYGGESTDLLAVFRLINDSLHKIYSFYDHYPHKGLQTGYINGDDNLDLIVGTPFLKSIKALLGNGDATFNVFSEVVKPELTVSVGGTLNEFTGDQFLDYVELTGLSYVVYHGTGDGTFSTGSSHNLTDSAKTINAADVNVDGATDLLIGTTAGIQVFLNAGDGTFQLAHSYAQDFRALDLDVTNQGSDFDSDGNFDLSVATPSVGGESSEVIVYLGNGDGTFVAHRIRNMRGQAFATAIGDFNNDLDLDIAYTNSARKYVGILYGDGSGSFLNEQRIPITGIAPRALETSDVDRDGDLDLVVGSYFRYRDSKLMLLRNRLDPPGYMASKLRVAAQNNADAQITSPSDQTLNSVKRTIASGSAFCINADGDDVIDEALTVTAIESGPYSVVVRPRAGQTDDATFSLDFSIDNTRYRLAQNQPNRPGGYQFTIYPDGSSPVTPAPGSLLVTPNPQLSWLSSGNMRLEIARDLAFTDIVETATLSAATYTPAEATGGGDTTTYYWRVKDMESDHYSDTWVFSVVPTPTDFDPETGDGLPVSFSLSQNYPNPFNPTTTIAFALPTAEHVQISIFDVTGRQVKKLLDQNLPAGEHSISWDGTDNRRHVVSSGIYLYRLEAGPYRAQKKMSLVR